MQITAFWCSCLSSLGTFNAAGATSSNIVLQLAGPGTTVSLFSSKLVTFLVCFSKGVNVTLALLGADVFEAVVRFDTAGMVVSNVLERNKKSDEVSSLEL